MISGLAIFFVPQDGSRFPVDNQVTFPMDARVGFYNIYRERGSEYDAKRVQKYDEDFNTALVFVRRPLLACPPHRLTY